MIYFSDSAKTCRLVARTMHTRFLVTTVAGLALIFSQGGHFLVAAFCPHLTSKAASCESSNAPAEMAHHDMDHMQGDSSEQGAPLSGLTAATAVSTPTGDCDHCFMHSRQDLPTSQRHSNVPERSADPIVSLQSTTVIPVSTLPTAVLASKAHGPPGSEVSRHILLNVFRI